MTGIRLDASRFRASLSSLQGSLDQQLAAKVEALTPILRAEAATIAEQLSERTFPSPMAIGYASRALRFDVGRVYCTASKVYQILESTSGKNIAVAFYAAWKRGDISAARRVLRQSGSPISNIEIGSPLNPNLRESVRDKHGRVQAAYPLQVVTASELKSFAAAALREIGKTSAGWSACAEQLGGDGNKIRWKGTTVHGASAGEATITATKSTITATLHNKRPLARHHISPSQLTRILAAAIDRLRAKISP